MTADENLDWFYEAQKEKKPIKQKTTPQKQYSPAKTKTLNILWFIFGGWYFFLWYLLAGVSYGIGLIP